MRPDLDSPNLFLLPRSRSLNGHATAPHFFQKDSPRRHASPTPAAPSSPRAAPRGPRSPPKPRRRQRPPRPGRASGAGLSPPGPRRHSR